VATSPYVNILNGSLRISVYLPYFTDSYNECLNEYFNKEPAVIIVRKAGDRGRTRLDWLDSRHTFSFADYYDPDQMGFSVLRVINDDRMIPGGGFPTHPHRDMEIISYVLDGSLEHRDSMGNTSVIRPGDIQRMSAGRGVTHSEFNASSAQPVHFLQIWIQPDKYGADASYEQKQISREEKLGRMRLVASPDGRNDSVVIQQDVSLYVTLLDKGRRFEYQMQRGRKAYLHVASGAAQINGANFSEGDGARISDEELVSMTGKENAEILLFDLP